MTKKRKRTNAEPLIQADLDRLASEGCQVPGCTHDIHDQVYMSASCHSDAQVSAQYVAADVLQISCAECGRFVCRVAVDQTSIQKWHRQALLEVEYTRGRGTLHLIC